MNIGHGVAIHAYRDELHRERLADIWLAALKEVLDVEVFAANAAAIAFYGRLGFSEVSRSLQDEDVTPQKVVLMRRPAQERG